MQQVTSTSSLINNYRTEDPRSPLQKLGRRQLRAFCVHYNLPYKISMPATALREIIAGSGYAGTEPYTYPAPRSVEAPAVQVAIPEEEPLDLSVLPPEIKRLSPPQLKKILKGRGIKTLADGSPITNRAKKLELLEALLNSPAVSPETPQMGFGNG